MTKKIVTLELFGGMGTGIQALKNLGWKGEHYYSDIKPAGIKVTKSNHPGTVFLGDITKINYINGFLFNDRECYDVGIINLVSSGSPCTDLSIAGKRKGMSGEKSKLFFEFIRLLNQIRKVNPDVLFFQENVGSASMPDVKIISDALRILPVRFNSKLVVAQLRDRYYWSNIKKIEKWDGYNYTDFQPPKDRKIMFKNILENGNTNNEKAQSLLMSEAKTFGYKDMNKFTELIKRRTEQGRQLPNLVYVDREKARTLLESESRPYADIKLYQKRVESGFGNLVYIENNEVRVKTNTVKGYDVLTENDCLNLSFPTSETRRGRVTKDKSPALLKGNDPLYSLKYYTVRILSKIELLRLQGFPDNYCDVLTRNQTASVCGDGWTLPMVEHFYKEIII